MVSTQARTNQSLEVAAHKGNHVGDLRNKLVAVLRQRIGILSALLRTSDQSTQGGRETHAWMAFSAAVTSTVHVICSMVSTA
jgi:hypothetical protein